MNSRTCYLRCQLSKRSTGVLSLACLQRIRFILLSGLFLPRLTLAAEPQQESLPLAPKTGLAFPAAPGVQDFFRARVFEEPLVPVGSEPTVAENADLAAALIGYSKRSGPDDFSSLTGFLQQHPQSPWAAALLTDLGLEYYHTARYSLALEAWAEAWALAKDATDSKGRALADRAFGELIYMNARLGRMDEIQALLEATEHRPVMGPAIGRADDARAALWMMQHRPEISFRCGPLALRSIRLALGRDASSDVEVLNSASTQRGCSLPQVAKLSTRMGLNFQMAFRNPGADFVVPSVVHWKVGHYAALVRKGGDSYELRDPTFGNSTWATKAAIEAEASGYFLVPPGQLPPGWRRVEEDEGDGIWGKGQTGANDPQHIAKNDYSTQSCPAQGAGMATAKIHLMDVNLNLSDMPLGYTPPVGPPVRLSIRYNARDIFQPANFNYVNFGPQWTCDWIAYITDSPSNVLADVNEYLPGGGQRTFTGFDTNTQTFANQQYDQTRLRRTGPDSYELLSGDGSKLIFDRPDGSIGSTRKVFMTQIVDPQDNALTLSFDADLRPVALTDAIGQVTTLSYELTNDIYKVTKVTDPFGRSATFNYGQIPTDWHFAILDDCPVPSVVATPTLAVWLQSITDVIGLTSRFSFQSNSVSACAVCSTSGVVSCVTNSVFTDVIVALTTPYGATQFEGQDTGNVRYLKITYPDGSSEIVQYDQTNNVPQSEPPLTVPTGMLTVNSFMPYRNSYHWDRIAAPSYPDHSKARLFHWLHTENLGSTSGALESTKQPLENRVWYDYLGQAGTPNGSVVITSTTLPAHIGRVLDDGSTQLYTYGHDGFGHLTNSIDPGGRTLSYLYDTNGIDLLEIRQTRAAKNELLVKATYNRQHLPLTITDTAGQTSTFTYNARGQLLTASNAKNETITLTYASDGYLTAIDGPLPGPSDRVQATYDAFGRPETITDVNGYTVTYAYDNLDRRTHITYPDGTFTQFAYDRLDCVGFLDRAGRQTSFEYDSMRQLAKRTDPLGRATLFQWCRCGAMKSLTDSMGRTTSWLTDVQGRRKAKQYSDGSQVRYFYENTTSRLRRYVDERGQATYYAYNADGTLRSIAYGNAEVPTPGVSFTYDPDYRRVTSMTDGIGTTTYAYIPITASPALGAGKLASVTGPLTNEIVSYAYDELGRVAQSNLDGVPSSRVFDAAGRITTVSNALGTFAYSYASNSSRVVAQSFPNGQTASLTYGGNLQDFALQQLFYSVRSTPVSQFMYGRDNARGRITTWSQQVGSQLPSLFTFSYDAGDQLISATVTNSGTLVNVFAYTYDAAGNRLSEQAGAATSYATYNALNQISTTSAPGASHTNEWDAAQRLAAVNAGTQRTEFGYDGLGRLNFIRQLQAGAEVSLRRFVWCSGRIREERDASGATVTKRFFPQGVKLESGPAAGDYYYTRDHLGSVRELTDHLGNVRARYAYDPFGRRTKLEGDLETDFGFAGLLWSSEASLALAHFRAYDPAIGRWLSRDPLMDAEARQGPNLYAYVGNEPVNNIDSLGLCTGSSLCACFANPANAAACSQAGITGEQAAEKGGPQVVQVGQQIIQAGQEWLEGGEAAAPEAANCAAAEAPAVQQAYQTGQGVNGTDQALFQKAAEIVAKAPIGDPDVDALAETPPPELADTAEPWLGESDYVPSNWDWAYRLTQTELNITREMRDTLPQQEAIDALTKVFARNDAILRILNTQK